MSLNNDSNNLLKPLEIQNIQNSIVGPEDKVLITGAGGFIGAKVVERLLQRGFFRIRCLARSSSGLERLMAIIAGSGSGKSIELVRGNLLSKDDCAIMTQGVAVIYHLAAGRGEKSYPDAYMNSVVTTRNLLEASVKNKSLRRFVNVSSLTVYSNRHKLTGRQLDESSPIEEFPHLRGEAYCYAKVRQDQMVMEYGLRHGVPWVILRPGYVYGPGNEGISSRIGIGTFGLFLHLGGANLVPLSYVDNCAEAIVLSGLKPGIDGEVFNVIDDDLISSRRFLHLYKKNVGRFSSLFIPRLASYLLCWFWEAYSDWTKGQLPLVYNRRMWHAYWKGSRYSNQKLKQQLGWAPVVSTEQALDRYFESCRKKLRHA